MTLVIVVGCRNHLASLRLNFLMRNKINSGTNILVIVRLIYKHFDTKILSWVVIKKKKKPMVFLGF